MFSQSGKITCPRACTTIITQGDIIDVFVYERCFGLHNQFPYYVSQIIRNARLIQQLPCSRIVQKDEVVASYPA